MRRVVVVAGPIALMLVSLAIFHLPLVQRGYFGGVGDWYHQNYDVIRQGWVHHHLPTLRDESAAPAYGLDMRDSLACPFCPALSPWQWLFLFGMSTDTYILFIIAGYAAVGCLALYLLLKDLGVPVPVALIFALLYSESSWVPARLAIGHTPMIGVALLPVVFLGFHRAVAGGRIWLAAFALAFSALEGFMHSPVWIVLFGSAYAVFWFIADRRLVILWVWGRILGAAFLVGAVKFVPMMAAHASYIGGTVLAPFNLHTLSAALTMRGQVVALDLVPNEGWWEYSCYVGLIGVFLMVTGSVFSGRKGWPWIALAAFTLALMLPTPLFGWLHAHLPLWQSERSPPRYAIIAVLAFSVAGAQGIGRAWTYGRSALLWVAWVLLFGWLTYDLALQARPWLLGAVGLQASWVATPQDPGTAWAGLLGAFLTGVGVTLCVVPRLGQRLSKV